ncbi:MAG: DUF1800 domain-containing protein [Gemmatimonadota bacterium]|nr:DUF1800 domain-containing protein [Gemmatimonadota bacterium]
MPRSLRAVSILAMALVTGLSACSGASRPPAAILPEPAAPDREQTADQQVVHLLNRLAFGPRPGDVEKVRAVGVDAWIAQQLHPERMNDAALESFVSANYRYLNDKPATLELRFPPPGQIQNQAAARGGLNRADSARLTGSQAALRQLTMEVQSARVARAVIGERQLHEVLTDFWLNHFSVFDAKGPRQRYLLAEYENRVIRPNAFGKFRTLLGEVAKSEAMLFYLDNWQSQADANRPRLAAIPGRGGRAGATVGAGVGRGGRAGRGAQPQLPAQIRNGGLNENYGRELLELHTLGVDGGYTQQDVINAARALTGWTFRGAAQGGGFQFVPFMHDAGEKKILGHALKANRGIEDGEQVLDIVARHPATARYISFKLARRFVTDSPSAALVARAARVFTETDGDIRETMRSIITSPEFFSRAAYRSKVKSPFEVVTSAVRALGGPGDPTARTAALVGQLGQPIYGHQAPNGWPETGDRWMNTGAILNRINFGMFVAAGRLQGVTPLGFTDADILRTATTELQVDGVIGALLGGDVSPDTRALLISGENPLVRAEPSPARPPAGGGRGFGNIPPLRSLPLVVGLALGSPEFQRR